MGEWRGWLWELWGRKGENVQHILQEIVEELKRIMVKRIYIELNSR